MAPPYTGTLPADFVHRNFEDMTVLILTESIEFAGGAKYENTVYAVVYDMTDNSAECFFIKFSGRIDWSNHWGDYSLWYKAHFQYFPSNIG